MIVNSDTSLQSAIGELREQYRVHRFVQVKIVAGKKRSVEQNAVLHGWFGQVARELREDDERGVKRFCKLHFGVPLLRAEDEEFRDAYDRVVRPLPYESKLIAMDILPVTSAMTTKQLDKCMTDIQDHYAKHGVALVYPREKAA
ncbi:hypothetical protein GN331_04960 [Lysobacter sp. HX-5-24]|uniref:Uncharacterized protein n=1 Tax=Noviluteimonas gilva TaxID=2682097 RepID=A0A7C9HLH5_9GAMM|nr:hypothetical protein [Lysobacter gilvus]MUV13556.1 hypothetical protein [Lysobacter gilvus]